jgi:ABC-type dipeptide/oligopeptide/nickel transport system permease component
VHRRLDRVSQSLFQLAVVSVSTYLALTAATAAGLFPHALLTHSSKAFSFLGVALPTFGGAVAGIRYFGDFERFAAISDVTAEKLEAVGARIRLLLTVPDARLDYARAAELARLTDEIVTSEIESWQAVFGGKHITLPV